MTSPYGPSGGNDPQPQWGQQPYGGGYPGTPSGGFPAQNPGYGQPDPSQQQPPQQPQWGQQPQPTQQYPAPGGYDPSQPQSNPYGQPQQNPYGQPPQQNPYGQPNPYGQQQDPYAAQNPYGQPQQPPKKSGAVLWVVVALVVLVVAAVGILGFVTPGFFKKKVFDNTAVQNGIVQILTTKGEGYGLPDVSGATCTGEHEVKPNTTFECTAKVGGKDKKVKITVKTVDGEYEVGQPAG